MSIESTIKEQYASTGTASGQKGLAASRPSVNATIWPSAAQGVNGYQSFATPQAMNNSQVFHGDPLENKSVLPRKAGTD